MDLFEKLQGSIIATCEVPHSEIHHYGVIRGVPLEGFNGRVYRVQDVVEKPPASEAPSNMAIIGRYILTPEIFPILEKTRTGSGNEIQLTDGIRVSNTRIYEVRQLAGPGSSTARSAIDAEFLPDPTNRAQFDELYREFRNRYKADKAMHARLNDHLDAAPDRPLRRPAAERRNQAEDTIVDAAERDALADMLEPELKPYRDDYQRYRAYRHEVGDATTSSPRCGDPRPRGEQVGRRVRVRRGVPRRSEPHHVHERRLRAEQPGQPAA